MYFLKAEFITHDKSKYKIVQVFKIGIVLTLIKFILGIHIIQ